MAESSNSSRYCENIGKPITQLTAIGWPIRIRTWLSIDFMCAHIVAKGNFLIESKSLTFDMLARKDLLLCRWEEENCSVNQFLCCKSIFCSPLMPNMAAIFLRRASSTSTPILHESLFVSHLALCRGLCFYNSNSIIFLTLRKALSVQCIFQPWKSYSLYYKSAKFGWILKVFKRSQKKKWNQFS